MVSLLAKAAAQHAPCGQALQALVDRGYGEVLESYGPFEAPHPYNPCLRKAHAASAHCLPWGFAVFRYNESCVEVDVPRPARGGRNYTRCG